MDPASMEIQPCVGRPVVLLQKLPELGSGGDPVCIAMFRWKSLQSVEIGGLLYGFPLRGGDRCGPRRLVEVGFLPKFRDDPKNTKLGRALFD